MKNRSIRFKLTLWFTLAQIAVVAITLLAVLGTSQMVLRGTIRDYLIGTVEENVDNIKFAAEEGGSPVSVYIPYKDGYLVVDADYMEVINDVHTALYTKDGTMLYGANPLSHQTANLPFEESHTWNMKVDGIRYDLYDRKVNLEGADGDLWIRGIVPETESATQLKTIARILAGLLPFLILLTVLFAYFLADRLLAPIKKIEETATRITDEHDWGQRIEAVNKDDEVGRLAKAFNRMMDRLEHSYESERQFTSDASHELRTPTSVILAQTDYTLEKDRTPEEYKEALEVVQKQGNRMNTLIGDMLDYTRMEQSAERYPFDTVDLSELVSETAGQMAMLRTNGITLHQDIAGDVSLKGNPLLLSRLLQNLISNAYRYGRENGRIDVSLKEENGHAVLTVADDGIGIAKAEQEKIFDRFYRSDASRTVQGTGLGLSMVKRIAEMHGARVELESEEGAGSIFRIVF